MKFLKLALLGTAALAAASVSARADSLDSLKAAMDNLNIGAVADAPAAAAPATSVVWNGYVRAGVTTSYNSTQVPSLVGSGPYATDVRGYGEIKVTAKTETAVGEVGVAYQIQSNGAQEITNNGIGINGNGNGMSTDDIFGWWKMTPNLTLNGGINGTIAKSSYSWDAVATNWWSAWTGGGVNYSPLNNDPAFVNLAYADGPLSAAFGIEDSNNNNGSSAVGVVGKIGYKMDAIGFDLQGGYWGNAGSEVLPAGNSPQWAISAGAGYSAGALNIGAAIGTEEQWQTGATYTPGSIYAKVNMSDVAHIELGATHDFSNDANDGLAGATTFGGGIYYTPVKQLALGIEGGYQTGGAAAGTLTSGGVSEIIGNGNGSYSASIVSQFMF